MKTRSHIIALALAALALSPHLARGQSLLIPEQILRIKAANLVCNAANDGKLYRAFDQSAADDCDTTGGGTVSALCLCDNLSFVPLVTTATDLAAYVPVTKAGQQALTATGAGNDIKLTAADTIVLSIAGLSSLVASSGGDNFVLFTSGATNSELNISAGNDADGLDTAALSLYSEDDAATFTMELSNTGPKLSAEQSTGLVTVSRAGFRISPTAAPTVACAGGTEGTLYLDSDTHLLCVCNGTGYVQVADGTTACS